MSKVAMQVVGQPFRGVPVGGTVKVSLKDSRSFADNLAPAPVKAPKIAKAKKSEAVKAPAKKSARKAPAKKAAAKKTYSTRAMKAAE